MPAKRHGRHRKRKKSQKCLDKGGKMQHNWQTFYINGIVRIFFDTNVAVQKLESYECQAIVMAKNIENFQGAYELNERFFTKPSQRTG